MFPDISGLKHSVDANTAAQHELIALIKQLSENVGRLTKQLETANKAAKGTNSTGPK